MVEDVQDLRYQNTMNAHKDGLISKQEETELGFAYY